MKKKLFFITLYFLSISFLFAQTPFEGFDGFPWNTNVSEFLKKYPSAIETTDTDAIERNERTPSLKRLKKIAKQLNVSVEYLVVGMKTSIEINEEIVAELQGMNENQKVLIAEMIRIIKKYS